MNVIGISAYYHESARSLLQDGRLVAAAEEERFSRVKHDARPRGCFALRPIARARSAWTSTARRWASPR